MPPTQVSSPLLKHFSHFPSALRKAEGQMPIPATFSPKHHLTGIPGVIHTTAPTVVPEIISYSVISERALSWP